jgi:hypothetical protein
MRDAVLNLTATRTRFDGAPDVETGGYAKIVQTGLRCALTYL